MPVKFTGEEEDLIGKPYALLWKLHQTEVKWLLKYPRIKDITLR